MNTDLSGSKPSVKDQESKLIIDKILSLFPNKPIIKMLDIGCGLGYLQKNADSIKQIDCYSLDISLLDNFVGNPLKRIIHNIANTELKDKFDITTSFEFIEHIHRYDINNLFKNISSSSLHLCSINTRTKERLHRHVTILNSNTWQEYFRYKNIDFQVCTNLIPNFNKSEFFLLDLTNINNKNIILPECGKDLFGGDL